MRHSTYVPDVSQNLASGWLQYAREFAVIVPCASDSFFVDRALWCAETRALRRNVGLRTIQLHVALTLLFGVIKRMRVKQRPHKLPADIFQSEFEMGVLKYGVMSAIVSCGSDRHALLVSDFLETDKAGRIACASSRNRRIERMSEIISQRYPRRSGFHLGSGRRIRRWIKLRGHFLVL